MISQSIIDAKAIQSKEIENKVQDFLKKGGKIYQAAIHETGITEFTITERQKAVKLNAPANQSS